MRASAPRLDLRDLKPFVAALSSSRRAPFPGPRGSAATPPTCSYEKSLSGGNPYRSLGFFRIFRLHQCSAHKGIGFLCFDVLPQPYQCLCHLKQITVGCFPWRQWQCLGTCSDPVNAHLVPCISKVSEFPTLQARSNRNLCHQIFPCPLQIRDSTEFCQTVPVTLST